jgi:hypothetical protein
MATAERNIGMETLWPRMVVDMSTSFTFTMTRGLSHRRWNALWFSRRVISSSDPDE